MEVANHPPIRRKTVRRIWKTPGSKFNWFFLASSLFVLGWVFLVYRSAVATQPYPGPYNDPFRQFGIVAFVLVLLVAGYTMRRRFMRNLPGKVQDWLWLHIWFGVISVLIAFMHNNFQGITHDFSFLARRFTEAAYGTTALYALLALVVTGIIGRLLDLWQARVIAAEADRNGVGITRSVEERLFDLSLTIERLSAGKSDPFKQFCEQRLLRGKGLVFTLQYWWKQRNLRTILASIWAQPPDNVALSRLPPREAKDFNRAGAVLAEHAMLARSLRRQQLAQMIISVWRYIHIPLACAATAIIGYHSLFELWKMLVLHQ
jgi:hypothetical protein